MPEMHKSGSRAQRGRLLREVGTTLFVGGLVGVSLLTFPADVLIMVAVWLALHCYAVLRKRPGWAPLLTCLAIVLVKRTALLPGVSFLLVVIALVAALRLAWQFRKGSLPRPVRYAALGILWFAWLVAAVDSWQSERTARQPVLDPRRPVVCLGDSLTAYGYPDVLSTMVSVPVVNLGRDGISTTDALELLPAIRELNPQAVVVELGGHDFLLKHGQDTCRRNLETIIAECRTMGAEVVLVEIPRGLAVDPFAGQERHLARSHDLELISDSVLREFILMGPYAPPGSWLPRSWHLSNDGLHPNERGNERLARKVRNSLVRLFGQGVLVSSL